MVCSLTGSVIWCVVLLRFIPLFVESRHHGHFPKQGFFHDYDDADKNQDQNLINSPACGQATVAAGRVIGGTDASAGEWPWQAKLETRKDGFICGGSLIAPTWVMTAAHCISETDPSMYTVTLGDLNREKPEDTEQKFSARRVVPHPEYNSPVPVNNDIALIELTRPVVRTSFVNTVCLPSESEVVSTGTKCFVSGWGQMNHPGAAAINLQQAGTPVVSNRVCQAKSSKSGIDPQMAITSAMLCAGDAGKTVISPCFGDSGGPFVCQDYVGRWVQQGIVSWGSANCSSKTHFSVFTRVSVFRNWIDQVLSN